MRFAATRMAAAAAAMARRRVDFILATLAVILIISLTLILSLLYD